MRQIVLIGSGKSTHHLIQFLLDKSQPENFFLTVASLNILDVKKIIQTHNRATAIQLPPNDSNINTQKLIKKSDLVISMLPAHLHIAIAKICLQENKNLITASYVSPEMKKLNTAVQEKGLLFLNEMGLDPGLDHMSSMKIIDHIQKQGGTITSYQSYCGGLIAPESDTNPWNYKFTWNPRNVILAGQGTPAKYLDNKQVKLKPYNRLFSNTKKLSILGFNYEGYPNRNSIQYISTYKVPQIETMIRGTLRCVGFSEAWSIFVQLGLTDDSYTLKNSEILTPIAFLELFLTTESKQKTLIERIENTLGIQLNNNQIEKIKWLNWENDNQIIGIQNGSPAQLLEHLLKDKWQLKPNDKDMIVMNHIIDYNDVKKNKYRINSQLEIIGQNHTFTAMSKTVGLPLGLGALLILNNQISLKGVQTPVHESIYTPILEQLKQFNIEFKETKNLL